MYKLVKIYKVPNYYNVMIDKSKKYSQDTIHIFKNISNIIGIKIKLLIIHFNIYNNT